MASLGDVSIRRLRKDEDSDFHLLAAWLTNERVLEFYEGRNNPHDLQKVQEKYGPRVLGDRVVPNVIEWNGRLIGYLQYYPLTEDEGASYAVESVNHVYGIDLLIGEPERWNKGIGTLAVTAMTSHLFDVLGARRVVIDPQVTNARAIRCYEKAGFKKLKVLPKHEWHEGTKRDCWLMALEAPG